MVQPYNTDFVQKIREFCDLYTEIVKLGLEALKWYKKIIDVKQSELIPCIAIVEPLYKGHLGTSN